MGRPLDVVGWLGTSGHQTIVNEDQKLAEAIKEIKSKRKREWIRYKGKDYLAEYEAKKIIRAARLVVRRLVKRLDDD